MGQGGGVEVIADFSPVGKMAVHERDEAVVVVPFVEVDQLVNDYVFQAPDRLLDEFEVHQDPPRRDTARPPLGFHATDTACARGHFEDRLPFRQDGRHEAPELLAIPPV